VEPIPAADCRYDVSFVGAAYGNRRRLISALRRRGVKVACFGHGWERGAIGSSDVGQIYRGSRVSLNFADSGLQLSGCRIMRSRQIKARTFEVPGAGGMLLTQAADGLDRYLQPGQEIVTFTGIDDLARKIRHYLSRPVERDAIAQAGHTRVRRDHVYESRFASVLAGLQDAHAVRRQPRWLLTAGDLDVSMKRHRNAAPVRRAAAASASLGRAILRTDRGSRALRRLAFEASWRLCGERTYSAAGWPGRLFYGES
jgi:spore maturation protein CgeB